MSRYTEEYGRPARSSGLLTAGLTLLGGLAAGAAVMYLLDPEEGPSRRKTIRRGASGALESVHGLIGSAAEGASDLTGQAGSLIRHQVEEDDGGTGMMLTMIMGGSVLAAVVYMLTTEYDSIRRGDFAGAASHAYQRASDAVTSVKDAAGGVAGRVGEMFAGEKPEQPM